MKKLFGIFVAGAAALSLTSCGEDDVKLEDLESLFATAFSNGNLTNIDNYDDGLYEYSFNIREQNTQSYDQINVNGKLHKDGSNTIVEFNETGKTAGTKEYYDYDIAGYVPYEFDEEIVNSFVISQSAGEINDFFMKMTEVNTRDGEVVYEFNVIEEALEEYGTELTSGSLNADDYDWIRLSAGDSFSTQLIIDSIIADEGFGGTGEISSMLDQISFTMSDFLISDFTTYELKSQTEAYATVNFEPFNQQSYEAVFELMKSMSLLFDDGYVLTEEEFKPEWEEAAELYSDLVVPFKLGIDPRAQKINYISFDADEIFTYLEEDEGNVFNLELKYADSSSYSIPTDRVLEGNYILEQENYYELAKDVKYLLYNNDVYDDSSQLDTAVIDGMVGKTINELVADDYLVPNGWLVMFDLDTDVVTTDGTNYYLSLKWSDGSNVFDENVKVLSNYELNYTDYIMEFIDENNFMHEYGFIV